MKDRTYKTDTVMSVRIREMMIQRRISITELAEILQVTYACVWKYVTGKAQPDAECLAAICRTLNVSADYLIGLIKSPIKLIK